MNKVLVVDLTCNDISLLYDEFVLPICEVLKLQNVEFNVLSYKSVNSDLVKKYSHIILSGTALKDFDYLEYLDSFAWLKLVDVPVLGICAGMQVIGMMFGCSLVDCEEIGMIACKSELESKLEFGNYFEAYCLHQSALDVSSNFDILAQSSLCVEAIQLKEMAIYGCLFHPEVRNKDTIVNFLKL